MAELSLILTTFVSFFAGGRSDSKWMLLLIFAGGTAIVYRLKSIDQKKHAHDRMMLGGLLAAGFLLHLISYAYVSSVLHIPWFSSRVLYANDEISSSSLTHSHELKGSFAFAWEKAAGLFRSDLIDMGNTYMGILPPAICIAGLFILFGALLCWVRYVRSSDLSWKELTVHGIIFFMLIKNVFDGGILNHEVVAVGVFLLLFRTVMRNAWATIVLPYAFLLSLWLFGDDSFYLAHLMVTLLFLSALLALRLFRMRYAAIAFVPFLYVWGIGMLAGFSYIFEPVTKDTVLVAYDDTPIERGFMQEGSIGRLKVYRGLEESDMSYRDVIEGSRLNRSHYPLVTEWKHCIPTGSGAEYAFRFHTQGASSGLEIKDGAYATDFYHLDIRRDGEDYYATLHVRPCITNRLQDVIGEALREQGAYPVAIFDLSVL